MNGRSVSFRYQSEEEIRAEKLFRIYDKQRMDGTLDNPELFFLTFSAWKRAAEKSIGRALCVSVEHVRNMGDFSKVKKELLIQRLESDYLKAKKALDVHSYAQMKAKHAKDEAVIIGRQRFNK